jgi:hypothetical protein
MPTHRASAIRAIFAFSLVSLLPACSGTMKFGVHDLRMPGGASERSAKSAANAEDPALAAEGFSQSEQERIAAVQTIVEREADTRDLDPNLVYAVIWVESRFDPKAKSPAGARGLMQLMPATAAHLAKELGEKRPKAYDPDFNIRAGAYYLDRLLERFDGDETLAVAAYNAGPGNVSKWQKAGDDLPEYSQDYVAKVMAARSRFAGQDIDPIDPALAAPAMEAEDASTEVILVQRPKQRAEAVSARQVIAHQERQLVPEPEMVFDEPVFEPAPDLDSQDAQRGPALRVAVQDAPGNWPDRDTPETDIVKNSARDAKSEAPTSTQELPTVEHTALPGLEDELGASHP